MVVFPDVLHNALPSSLQRLPPQSAGLLVIEFVYTHPGAGHLPVFAINNLDLPLVRVCGMNGVTYEEDPDS